MIRTKKDDFWSRERERRPLRLFHEVARRVPAYKDFLKRNKIQPEKIRTFKDFQLVPIISKNNYLRKYPLEKLCWDGTIKKSLVFTSTSGSTGEPFYFPRSERLDWEYSILAELFLGNSSYTSKGSTLVIVGFGMGVWIGGLITYKAFELASLRGEHKISIITPGINKQEIFNAFRILAPHYKETVLIGYAPFIKDVIDEARSQGINLRKLHLRILNAAEAYTEKFRDYIVKKASVKSAILDTLNIYGTADIGAMAWETPISILIRRLTVHNQALFKGIFSSIQKIPTLAQYNPLFITFEAPGGEVLLTGDNAIPLVRYAVGDHGGVSSFASVHQSLREYNINIKEEARRQKVEQHIYQLPFVYVYERADFSVKLHLRDIYPEIIRDVLLSKQFSKFLTGKFSMTTKYNAKHNQYLEVNLELRKGKSVTKRADRLLYRDILKELSLKTTGPGSPSEFVKRPNLIKISYWPYEHPLHFKAGIKQKWVKKQP